MYPVQLSLAALVFAVLYSLCDQARAADRFALLIGNQAYAPQVGRLKNPHRDVKLVAAALAAIGFDRQNIKVLQDADRKQMHGAIDSYVDDLGRGGPNTIGFFYYSGHGAADGRTRRNYLIPVGVNRLDRTGWYDAISLDFVVSKLSQLAPSAAHFVVFDACRNVLNLPVRGSKGFAPMVQRPGMFIAFSSSPGQTASDEGVESGIYAAALASELVIPGQDHLDVFQNIKERVWGATRVQQPWTRDGMLRRVHLAGGVVPSAQPTETFPQHDVEMLYWKSVKDSDDPADLQAYLDRYPKGEFAELARNRLDRFESNSFLSGKMSAQIIQKIPSNIVTMKGSEPSLITAVQKELRRVGCLAGPADGIWGPASKQAMKRFNQKENMEIEISTASFEAWFAIFRTKGNVCPEADLFVKRQPIDPHDKKWNWRLHKEVQNFRVR